VVTRKTFHGPHTGEFMGLPPTGNAISVDVIDIVRVRDGKFVEHWPRFRSWPRLKVPG